MSESFNSLILRARSNTIVFMLEIIKVILMKRIHTMRDQMPRYNGELCPRITKPLEDLKKKLMEFIAHWNGYDQFEIKSCYGSRFRLNLGGEKL